MWGVGPARTRRPRCRRQLAETQPRVVGSVGQRMARSSAAGGTPVWLEGARFKRAGGGVPGICPGSQRVASGTDRAIACSPEASRRTWSVFRVRRFFPGWCGRGSRADAVSIGPGLMAASPPVPGATRRGPRTRALISAVSLTPFRPRADRTDRSVGLVRRRGTQAVRVQPTGRGWQAVFSKGGRGRARRPWLLLASGPVDNIRPGCAGLSNGS